MFARLRFNDMTHKENYVFEKCLKFNNNKNMKTMHR